MRTLVAAGMLAVVATFGVVVAAGSASAATVRPADCIWRGGNPICTPNQ
ncbi:MAG TPA: hypothetical protein VL551_02365 [Actinospica sp.]|jgi:hypothetical protein|nr:hypothetical protein [Actinospica sp.]